MIATREDNPRVWTLGPEQLTLEQALEILNPDNKDYIYRKRGAFKRVLMELEKLKKKDV